ncbi:MAG: Fur family transcriptional regulator, partial [Dehalococcoidia bacterium]
RAGYRPTPQRLMIARALRHAEGHISAPHLAEVIGHQFPGVDVSTVYRTLDVLRNMKVITSTDLGTGDVMFEWSAAEPHHHAICSSCGEVTELPHSIFAQLADDLDDGLGFRADLDHFAIFGLCRECRPMEERDDDPA